MIPSKQPKRAEAGAVIGGYELVRRVGRGGMAEVWVARKALGKKGSKFVAIKLIADHYVGDERYLRMFRSEAELAALLSHANIVQVFDEGEDEGRSYLVMEWVDGLNLLKLGDMLALIDEDQRRFRAISYIIGQLLHALHYAHSITSADGHPLGVVHRDVSPQNVLVSNHGEVKLTDFGVAYYNIEESSGIHVKGKVRYMSPEQLGGKTRSPTVDLYAVGALLHELLDGKKFRGGYDDGQELFAVVLSGHVPPLSRYAPPELDRLRLGLLEADPKRRIASAEQALTLLRRYPDYGDARDELTKLCGSLTGIVKPRAGPGQSSLVPAAEQVTTRWGGLKAFAKAQMEAGRKAPPPPPPAAKPSAPASVVVSTSGKSTGSTTAVKGAAEQGAETGVLITGETEILLRPQLRQGGLAAPVVSTNAPTTPLQVSSLRGVEGEGEGEGEGEPQGEGEGTQGTTRSLEGRGDDAEGYGHVMGEAAGYGLEQAASAAPSYVPTQGSHPIVTSTEPVWIDPHASVRPTQEMPPRAQQQQQPQPQQPQQIITYVPTVAPYDVGGASGVEQEAFFAGGSMGEGSDTRREARGASFHTTSAGIVPQQRSMMAAIGVVLMIVAVMSVGVTWLLLGSGRDGGASTTGTELLAANVVEPTRGGATPAAAEAGEGAASAPTEDEEAASPPAAVDGSASNEVVAPTVETARARRAAGVTASAPRAAAAVPGKKPSKAPSKAWVKITSSTGLEKAEVRLGSQTFKMSDVKENRVVPGVWVIKWRKSPSESWQTSTSFNFRPGKHFVVHVSKKGPKAYDAR